MEMPPLDPAILARRSEIVAALRAIVPGEGVIDDLDGMRPFECDALSAYRQMPLVVVLPETVAQVAAILRYCQDNKVKVVPRGAGTSLSGGSMPVGDAILLAMGKFNRVLEIDYANRCARVQPGVTNLGVTKAVEHEGFYYAPDPSSQIACSIGGNVAENSGGVHCLKYGLTTNNLLGIEMVLMNGEVVRLGGKHLDSEGYDLLGLMTGSEGLLGVVTEVTVRLLRKPSTARAVLLGFPTEAGAADCVAAVIASGIIPGGMEMMDKEATKCAEAYVGAGYPLDAEGLLIVELDGPPVEVDHLVERVAEIARDRGATTVRVQQRRAGAGAVLGRPQGRVPRRRPDLARLHVPRRLGAARKTGRGAGRDAPCCRSSTACASCNVFHAGDGNLHPLILFDANDPADLKRCEELGADILRLCVRVGGVLTGEHGVGIEKRDLMGVQFTEIDLDQQMRVKCAFDPDHLLNPGKVFPKLRRCAELGRLVVTHNKHPVPRHSAVLDYDGRVRSSRATPRSCGRRWSGR